MRPIILSSPASDSSDGRPLYINPDRLAYFKAASTCGETYLFFADGAPALKVSETPEQILRRLEDNRSALRAESRDRHEVYAN
jgi:hypothetical protein